MADVAKAMFTGAAAVTDTLLYTAPATGAVVRSIHATNTAAADATITIGLRAGAALAAANHFVSAVTVPANGTYDWSGFAVLGNVETIRALASATTVTLSISGIEL